MHRAAGQRLDALLKSFSKGNCDIPSILIHIIWTFAVLYSVESPVLHTHSHENMYSPTSFTVGPSADGYGGGVLNVFVGTPVCG